MNTHRSPGVAYAFSSVLPMAPTEAVALGGVGARDSTTLLPSHRYVVNGRTPLEWYIDRYKIKRDKESSILNDPNG